MFLVKRKTRKNSNLMFFPSALLMQTPGKIPGAFIAFLCIFNLP